MSKLINEPGLIVDGNKIILNTDLWTTQALLTKKLKLKRNRISEVVRRGIKNGTLPTYYIEQLGTRVIPNVSSINELHGMAKKQ